MSACQQSQSLATANTYHEMKALVRRDQKILVVGRKRQAQGSKGHMGVPVRLVERYFPRLERWQRRGCLVDMLFCGVLGLVALTIRSTPFFGASVGWYRAIDVAQMGGVA